MSPVMVTFAATGTVAFEPAVMVIAVPSWMAVLPWPGPESEVMLPSTKSIVSYGLMILPALSNWWGTPGMMTVLAPEVITVEPTPLLAAGSIVMVVTVLP